MIAPSGPRSTPPGSGPGNDTPSLRTITWLPRCLICWNPCRLKRASKSAPENTRSLGMREFQRLHRDFRTTDPLGDHLIGCTFEPEFDRLLEHLLRVLGTFAL